MNKEEFDEFVKLCQRLAVEEVSARKIIDQIFEKFGREFIFDLPVEYKINPDDGVRYTVVKGTYRVHSTTEPAFHVRGKPVFYILGFWVTLDEWLSYSSLSTEERTIFKLKYA